MFNIQLRISRRVMGACLLLLGVIVSSCTNNTNYVNSQEDEYCIRQLIAAAEMNDTLAAGNLLENGCPVNGKIQLGTNSWMCPLSRGVHHATPDMAAFLLRHGADPNLALGSAHTPFHYAAGVSPVSTLKLLLDHEGRVNTVNSESDYQTPLLWAIAEGKVENVQLLIDHGASVNPDAKAYGSPLSMAISSLNFEMTRLLLTKGADVNAPFSEISEDCDACPHKITAMHKVVDMHSYHDSKTMAAFLELLLSYKPNLNAESERGYTPLEHACFGNNSALVDKLIAHGAKLETEKFSALHCAVKYSNYEMANHLLKKEINVNVRDVEGNTPLMVCYDCCGDGFGGGITSDNRINTVELLLDHQADPHIKNNKGESFVDQCKSGLREEITSLMVKKGLLTALNKGK